MGVRKKLQRPEIWYKHSPSLDHIWKQPFFEKVILRAPYLENCRVIWISAYLLDCLFCFVLRKSRTKTHEIHTYLQKLYLQKLKIFQQGNRQDVLKSTWLQFFEANVPHGHFFEKKTFFRCAHRMCLYQISGLYWFRLIRGSGKNKYTDRYTSKFLLGIPCHLRASRGFDWFSVAFSNFITIIIGGNFQNSPS